MKNTFIPIIKKLLTSKTENTTVFNPHPHSYSISVMCSVLYQRHKYFLWC